MKRMVSLFVLLTMCMALAIGLAPATALAGTTTYDRTFTFTNPELFSYRIFDATTQQYELTITQDDDPGYIESVTVYYTTQGHGKVTYGGGEVHLRDAETPIWFGFDGQLDHSEIYSDSINIGYTGGTVGDLPGVPEEWREADATDCPSLVYYEYMGPIGGRFSYQMFEQEGYAGLGLRAHYCEEDDEWALHTASLDIEFAFPISSVEQTLKGNTVRLPMHCNGILTGTGVLSSYALFGYKTDDLEDMRIELSSNYMSGNFKAGGIEYQTSCKYTEWDVETGILHGSGKLKWIYSSHLNEFGDSFNKNKDCTFELHPDGTLVLSCYVEREGGAVLEATMVEIA